MREIRIAKCINYVAQRPGSLTCYDETEEAGLTHPQGLTSASHLTVASRVRGPLGRSAAAGAAAGWVWVLACLASARRCWQALSRRLASSDCVRASQCEIQTVHRQRRPQRQSQMEYDFGTFKLR